ncbi:MAG: FtsX-like permease family protein [Candidatus Lokiarchaeota archaeon]|nr:FtsX-like permease family protein [Candidatus Lokiarchaeota archaeon]
MTSIYRDQRRLREINMKIMNIKALREIKNQKFRSIMIVGIVAVTITMLLGMRAGYPMIMASYEENLIDNNVADGRFTFSSFIAENNISLISEDETFLNDNNIDDVEGRLQFYTDIFYKEQRFPAIIIGIEYPNVVNQVYIESLSEDSSDDHTLLNSTHNCIIESRFAGSLLGQDVSLDENISVAFNSISDNFTIKAVGQDTDFIYVVDPVSQMTLMGQLAVVWMDLSVVQDIYFGGLPIVNQILYTVDDRLNKDMTLSAADSLTLKLDSQNAELSSVQFTVYDETADRNFFDADAGSVDKLGTIFGVIGLIVCCVAIFSMISRLVQSQRKNIGLFMSMGSNPMKIIGHYVKITMILSIVGIIIGIPLGHYFAVGMTNLLVSFFPFQSLAYPIVWAEYVIAAVATFVVCILFSGISAFPITRITPREAMSAVYNRIKNVKQLNTETILSKIPGFRSIHMLIPVREIFLRKKKSLITILAITTSMIILITSVAMVANMYSALTSNYEIYNTADYQVKMETPIPISNIDTYINGLEDDTIEHYELYISTYSRLIVDGKLKSSMALDCYEVDSTFRNVNVINGDTKNLDDTGPNKIILGNGIAGKYEINVGDNVEIGLFGNYSVEVGGLSGELIDFSVIWTIEAFQYSNITDYFGFSDGYVNGILFDAGANVDIADLREDMENQFDIIQWVDAEQAQQSVLTLMQTMMMMLVVFIGVGMIIGVLFSFNTMYMGFISREDDFLAFKAMGAERKYIRKIIFSENALLSIFSLLVTIPVGYFAYWQSMNYMIGDRFYMPISIPLYTWPIIFLLSLISIGLATQKITKKIKKMNLADELRQRHVT